MMVVSGKSYRTARFNPIFPLPDNLHSDTAYLSLLPKLGSFGSFEIWQVC